MENTSNIVNFRADKAFRARIVAYARAAGISNSEALRQLIEKGLNAK